MKNTILAISLLLNVAIFSIIFWRKTRPHNLPEIPKTDIQIALDNNRLKSEIHENLLSIDTSDTVFIGTSITEGFPVTELFGQHAKNRGIGWNTTAMVKDRLKRILLAHPKRIYFEMGVNDFDILGLSVDSVYANYIDCIGLCRKLSPNTSIVVQSVLPVSDKRFLQHNKEIVELNNRLQTYCKSNNLVYLDLYPLFVKDGILNPEYSYDGVHPNWKGYGIWKGAISMNP